MKNQFKIVLLCAMLATLFVACEKEESVVNNSSLQRTSQEMIAVTYAIDEDTYSISVSSGLQFDEFLKGLINIAAQGHSVSIHNQNAQQNLNCKETVHFTTKSDEEIVLWTTRMFNHGYDVHVTYNEATGEYVAIAER